MIGPPIAKALTRFAARALLQKTIQLALSYTDLNLVSNPPNLYLSAKALPPNPRRIDALRGFFVFRAGLQPMDY